MSPVFTYRGSFLFLLPPLRRCIRCGFKGKMLSDLRLPPAAETAHLHPLI